ncbi:MAG TPA: type II toxin-antitoxin system VapC family toxin [Verrucomicrobiales bacterium]|jgi:predicted nucleic acid-binding protein|nr:type II toxin-antitoxin system VapC family toxin [Verrucomicrobiales bacterium]
MAVYWDTSCVIKLYCRESDSEQYLAEIASATEALKSSSLLEAELYFAFQQKWLRQETNGKTPDRLFEEFQSDVNFGRIQLFPVGSDVIKESREVARLCFDVRPVKMLRTLDGLHLATARLLACERVLTADDRMKAVAGVLGL